VDDTGDNVNIQATLEILAQEHLDRMAAIGWKAWADTLLSHGHGEAFSCEVEGVYFDVGDKVSWLNHEGGDIRLTGFASAEDGKSAERALILRKNSN
jgi:hypothetical protein